MSPPTPPLLPLSPRRVRITDVSPRDGLQNEPGVIPSEQKARLVELLSRTGVDEVEVSSFVSPKWVPQLGDVREVLAHLRGVLDQWSGPVPRYSFLVPNTRGLQDAWDINTSIFSIDKVAVITAASETFTQKNTNATMAESLDRIGAVMEMAGATCGGPPLVRGYISCAIACPFEGPIAPARVADVAQQLVELGVSEIDLGDTIGAGTPETVRAMLGAVLDRIGEEWLLERVPGERGLTLHLHDTFGRASECVKAALDRGVTSFDGSVAGLGGCPYASTPTRRAPGNIDTLNLVRTIHAAGFATGVDLIALNAAAEFAREMVSQSRAGGGAA